MEIYLNFLWLVPFGVWIATRKISQRIRCTLVGASFGLIVPYASIGLYALHFIWPVFEAFGQFCFYLIFIHDLAGIRVAIFLQLISEHNPIADNQRVLIEIVNALSWAIAYGALGFVWGCLKNSHNSYIKSPETSKPK